MLREMERIYLLLIMRQQELNDDTNKYMVFTRDQNGGRSYSIRIDNGLIWRNSSNSWE